MNVIDFIKRSRSIITILLALAGIAIMAYYETCDTACSYLTGDIWGIDLKWIGMAYMSAIIFFCILKWTSFIRAMLAAGLGVEVFLIAFQIKEDVFCPFCLAFAVIVIAAFIVNYERSIHLGGSFLEKILYALGEFTWPPIFKQRIPLILFVLFGYLFVFFSFTGSATPAYGDSGESVPSWGSGRYEVLILSDYFCPPCQALEPQLEPVLEDLLRHGNVKVTFVDVPVHKPTILYNRFYLYSVNANNDFQKVLHARRTLFRFAQQSRPTKNTSKETLAVLLKEEPLIELFRKENIAFKPFDYRPVQIQLSNIIREYKIKSTPTCIVKYSENDIKEYAGTKEIMEGMETLKSTLKKGGTCP